VKLGCRASELEISAITGHQTSWEVSRYTKAARQKLLAKNGMAKLTGNKIVPLEPAMSVPGLRVRDEVQSGSA
jgi:hypothetical protein